LFIAKVIVIVERDMNFTMPKRTVQVLVM